MATRVNLLSPPEEASAATAALPRTNLRLQGRRQAPGPPTFLSAQPEPRTGHLAFALVPGRDCATMPKDGHDAPPEGTVAVMEVPTPGWLRISSLPPSIPTRSR